MTMALQELTNQQLSSYKLQATIGGKYKPLLMRGRPIFESTGKSTFHEKRKAGACNIDLWLDGSLYPIDPHTGRKPNFQTTSDLLEFVGDGENGLLGYVKHLENMSGGTAEVVRERDIQIQMLCSRIDDMICSWGKETSESGFEIGAQRSEICNLRHRLSLIQGQCDEYKNSMNMQIATNLRLEAEMKDLQSLHVVELSTLKEKLSKTCSAMRSAQGKLNRLKKTPYGIRSQIRQRRDVSTLAPNGGHAKSIRRLARLVVAPETTRKIQSENASQSTRKRLCGSKDRQVENGRVFASLLSRTEISSMLKSPSLSQVGVGIANEYMKTIGEHVESHAILETCDHNGITQKGYGAIYKRFKGGIQAAGKGLRLGCLPNPHKVSELRKELNSKLEELVGEHYCIDDTFQVAPCLKSKKKEPQLLHLHKFNNLFVDVEAVQRTMVRLYGITPEEVGEKPLIFVIKMDEAEIIHAEKLERVSITVMNRALNPKITKDSEHYFSVQAEREIWPIGCFRVPKETHEVLKWVFDRTKIPQLIKAQSEGQKLVVPEVGSFSVEWHLSADMKTIKALYGLQGGANAKHSCIYCMQQKTKSTIVTESQARAAAIKRTPAWEGGLFSSSVSSKPVSLVQSQSRWKPILPIPLERVHICTLHAFNRICEKMLHLIFQNVWTIRDKEAQAAAIKDIETILSSTGMHGGSVKIFKDIELSGKANNVPNKPSLSGANAHKLFKPCSLPGKQSDRLWREVVLAERDSAHNGDTRRERMQVWLALQKLIPFFTGMTLEEEQCSNFKELVNNFGHLFVKNFGESHVTHYIHVFVKHSPWFVEKYGSLSVWSCQGMEYSHHAAKNAYHRHTQHGGSKHKKSPLLQTYEHWYRIIQHRLRNKEIHNRETEQTIISSEEREEKIRKRREASLNSSATVHHAEWRAQCTREGSRWVRQIAPTPENETTQSIDEVDIDTHMG